MRTIYVFAAVLLSGFMAQSAFAKIGSRNLDEEQKRKTICYNPVILSEPTGASPDIVVGDNGVIAAMTLGHTGNEDQLQTSSVAPMLFPARVVVETVDDETIDDTLDCDTVVLVGQDQYGKSARETMTAITETAQVSVNVYSRIDRVEATDCLGGGSALDVLRVATCDWTNCVIGLGYDIRVLSDIESVCRYPAAATTAQCANTDWDGDGAVDIDDLSSFVSLEDDTITLNAVASGQLFSETATVTNGDAICFTIRPSK